MDHPHLTKFMYNKIGDEGAAALSKNVSWTTLTSLNLGSNNIGAEGAAALSKNVSWTTLTSLDLPITILVQREQQH